MNTSRSSCAWLPVSAENPVTAADLVYLATDVQIGCAATSRSVCVPKMPSTTLTSMDE